MQICQTKRLFEEGVGQPFQAVQAGWKACPKFFVLLGGFEISIHLCYTYYEVAIEEE
jgi:hypothetical protein